VTDAVIEAISSQVHDLGIHEKIVDMWLAESYRHAEKVAGRNAVSVAHCLGDIHSPSRLFF